jgi:ATP-dependent protease ClpP protease subunit
MPDRNDKAAIAAARSGAVNDLATFLNLSADEAELVMRMTLGDPAKRSAIEFRNADDGDSAELLLYGVIGFDPFDEVGGTSARQFAEGLAAVQDRKTLNVRINSPGGNVFEGFAIYNMLADAKPRVIVEVDGVAASAASIVAMAGDEIVVNENASMMIHNSHGIAMGDRRDFLKMADVAGKIDSQIASVYAKRTRKQAGTIRRMMDDETYMTAAEAVAGHFADVVKPAKGKGKAEPTNRADLAPSDDDMMLARIKARQVEIQGHGFDLRKLG